MPNLYTHTAISMMLILATIFKGKLAYTTISFVIHGYLSQFLFSIRGFETILLNYNLVSGIALMVECYVWLIILALFFNLKEKNNGEFSSTISK